MWKTLDKEGMDTHAHSRQGSLCSIRGAGHSHDITFNNNQRQSERDPKQRREGEFASVTLCSKCTCAKICCEN